MNKFFLIIVFIFIKLTILKSQITISKTIIDSETGLPISGAHVYNLNKFKTGTVTNKDGKFILNKVKKNSAIQISHISYGTFIESVNETISDTIKLVKKTYVLNEVQVATGKTIIHKVIDAFFTNHFVEPVMYDVYVRVSQFEKDYSELHVFSEYLIHTYQNKKHNSKFQITKMRAKPFSKVGKKYFKDMRVIQAISNSSNNIFYLENVLFKKRKLKNYNIQIVENLNKSYNNSIKLLFKPKQKELYTSIVLLIDEKSYAIRKIIEYYSESGEEFDEIGFKQIGNKWYLDYSKRERNITLFWKRGSHSNVALKVEAIYNINDSIQYDKKKFKSFVNIVAEPIKFHIGSWSDKFWENYNYIPLPDWIKRVVETVNSR